MQFVTKGKQILRQAILHDSKKEYEAALKCYLLGIDYFLLGIKYIEKDDLKVLRRQKCIYKFPKDEQNNPKVKPKKSLIAEIVYKKTKEFIERAEQLRKIINDEREKEDQDPDQPVQTKKRSKEKGKDKEEEDIEKKRLKDSIEDAILKEKPNVPWENVAGMVNAKKALIETLVLPRQYPQLFVGKRKPWKAVLLYGPPGTGKSYLAKAVATKIGGEMTFFSISSSSLVSKWLGESEKLVRTLFETALQEEPSIIFIDEIDSLCSKRGMDESESTHRIKTEFLVQMQKVLDSKKNVIILAATNRPNDIDSAMRRRFEKRIYIALPDFPARKGVLKIHAGKDIDLTDEQYDELAKRTEGFSCADINICVRHALMQPVRKSMKWKFFKKTLDENGVVTKIEMCQENTPGALTMNLMDIENAEAKFLVLPKPSVKDLYEAIKDTPPSVSREDIKMHEKFTLEYGIEG